ncbi:MAG: hypothetical protein U1F10_06735 [Burkholderiales bacterium]
MSDLTDDETDDAEELYLFQAGGTSCDVCHSLDGTYFTEPPARPHASCDCDITPVSNHRGRNDTPCGMEGWGIVRGQTERYGRLGVYFKVHATVVVVCADREVYEQEIEVDMGDLDQRITDESIFDVMDAMIFNEAAEVAEELAAMHCPPCSEFRCV